MKLIKNTSSLERCELWEGSTLHHFHRHKLLTVKELRNKERALENAPDRTKAETMFLGAIKETIRAHGG